MDTASLPNVLIMCLVFSSYMNVYCLIRAGSVCDYGCVFLYSFQWKILQLPRIFFFATTRMFVQQKICLQTGEVLPEMWEFSLPRSCRYGIPPMRMWRVMGSGRKWKVIFLTWALGRNFVKHLWAYLKRLMCVCLCPFCIIFSVSKWVSNESK